MDWHRVRRAVLKLVIYLRQGRHKHMCGRSRGRNAGRASMRPAEVVPGANHPSLPAPPPLPILVEPQCLSNDGTRGLPGGEISLSVWGSSLPSSSPFKRLCHRHQQFDVLRLSLSLPVITGGAVAQQAVSVPALCLILPQAQAAEATVSKCECRGVKGPASSAADVQPDLLRPAQH